MDELYRIGEEWTKLMQGCREGFVDYWERVITKEGKMELRIFYIEDNENTI